MTNVKISPALCAACGAALSYYCLFPLYRSESITINVLLALAFVPIVFLSLFRALVSFPLTGNIDPRTIHSLRITVLRLAAFAAGLAFGIGAGAMAVRNISFGIPPDTVRGISGAVLDDPRIISGGRAMTALSLKTVSGSGGERAGARGEITVFFPEGNAERLREFGRGTEVYAEGILREGTGNYAWTFTAHALHITAPAPPIERFRTGLRMNLAYRFTQPPSGDPVWGGLALALLLGIRDNLDAGFSSLYRDSGCAHILALSGMHLAILIALISFLLKRPLGLRLAAICGTVIILAYCYIVGPMPSLNRAALMYLLGVLAVLGMLKRDALLLLCMAFLIQLGFTPQAGVSLSFILSYLALAGILIIGDPINTIFKGTIPAVILVSLSASLGAFIATAPVSTRVFEMVRPVGILSSLLLTPLTTVFMIGAIAWIIMNLAAPALSSVLSYPLSLLYQLMEKIAFISAKTPGMTMNFWLVLLLSLLITAVVFWFERRRHSAINRLDPFA